MILFKPEDFDWILPEVGSSSFRVKLSDFCNEKLKMTGEELKQVIKDFDDICKTEESVRGSGK